MHTKILYKHKVSNLSVSYCTIKVNKQEINKNLKFKKEVGIAIKGKETSC